MVGGRRRSRWLLPLASALALTAVAAALLVAAQRRALAERVLLDALRERGLTPASLRVSRLGLGALEIRDLRIGEAPDLAIERLELRYAPGPLLQGRAESLAVSGLRLRGAVSPDGVSLGSLGALSAGESGGVGATPLALPLGRVVLESSRLDFDTPLGARRIEFDARAEPGEDGLAFGAELREASGLALEVRGSWDPAGGAGRAELELAPLRFAPGGLQPRDLHAPLGALLTRVSGSVEARGSLAWGGSDGATAAVDLALRDLSATTPAARFERVNAAIRLEGPEPLRTPPHQLLSVARIDLGLELVEGLVAFRLRPGGVLDLERAEWRFAGGTLSTAGRIDLNAPEQRLVLDVDGVDLASLLALVELEGLSGEGVLGGRLPLVRRGDAYEIRGARLVATAPPGWVRYRGDAAAAGAAAGAPGLGTLRGALENFRYDHLELDLDGETRGAMQIGLHLRGANPEFQGGRPVEFNLNLEARLSDILRSRDLAYQLPRAVEDSLRRFHERGASNTGAPPRVVVPGGAVDSATGAR